VGKAVKCQLAGTDRSVLEFFEETVIVPFVPPTGSHVPGVEPGVYVMPPVRPVAAV